MTWVTEVLHAEVTASSKLLSSFLYPEVLGLLLEDLLDLPSNANASIWKTIRIFLSLLKQIQYVITTHSQQNFCVQSKSLM